MADLSVVKAPVTGVSVTTSLVAASAGGDTAPTGDGRFLLISNAHSSSWTVTLATPGQVSGLDVAEVAVVVPAGAVAVVPLAQVFAQSPTGRANITYSGVTALSVAAFQLGS